MYYSVLLTCASFDLMPVLTALISRPRGPPNSSVVKVVQVVGLSGGPGLRFWIRIKFGSVLIQLFTWVRTNSEADRTIWDEPLVCLDISCLAISVSSLKQRKEILWSVMPKPGGPGGPLAPPIFDRLVNPIPTGKGRLCPPITTGTPNVFHLPASLSDKKNKTIE